MPVGREHIIDRHYRGAGLNTHPFAAVKHLNFLEVTAGINHHSVAACLP